MHLDELIPPADLTAAVEAGHVTRKAHPTLPLSILTYTPTCQYENAWTPVTTRCRGLIVNDITGKIVAWPFVKFFNIEEHELGRPYAPPLPKNEPFTVQDKADGSLTIVFHFDDRWHAASKGSFTSDQAQWAQKWLDSHDTSKLRPGFTYLAEMIYPENRIVVDYQGEETLKLLAIYGLNGQEIMNTWPQDDIWLEMGGSTIPVRGTINLSKIRFRARRNQTFDGTLTTGTDAEGYVLRYASGLRVKVKFPEYVRLHAIITGLTERSVWMLLRDGRSLKPLLDALPDEYRPWLQSTAGELRQAFHTTAVEIVHRLLASSLPADPRAFDVGDEYYSGALCALYDVLSRHAWDDIKPQAIGPRNDVEG